MTGRARWALAAAIALGGVLTATGPAAHAATSSCSSAEVTVVVDFHGLGGNDVRTGCASNPSSGLDALGKAGFQITQVANDPGFLCRIDNLPDASHEGCAHDPPSGAYWSYWHSSPGGPWSYADEGGATFKPAAGTVDGWSFPNGAACSLPPRYGSGATPSCPSTGTTQPTTTTQPPAPTTTQVPGTTTTTARSGGTTATTASRGGSPTTAPSSGTTSPPSGGSGGGGAGSGGSSSGPTTAGGTAGTTQAGGSTGTTGTTGAGAAASTPGSSAPDGTGSTGTSGTSAPGGRAAGTAGGTTSTTSGGSGAGSPAGALAGTGAIAAIGAGAAVTVQRRRRAADATGLDLPLDPPPDPPG